MRKKNVFEIYSHITVSTSFVFFFIYKHKENCDGSFNAQIRYYTNFYIASIATMDKKSNIL